MDSTGKNGDDAYNVTHRRALCSIFSEIRELGLRIGVKLAATAWKPVEAGNTCVERSFLSIRNNCQNRAREVRSAHVNASSAPQNALTCALQAPRSRP